MIANILGFFTAPNGTRSHSGSWVFRYQAPAHALGALAFSVTIIAYTCVAVIAYFPYFMAYGACAFAVTCRTHHVSRAG